MNGVLKILRLFALPLVGYCIVLLGIQVMFSFLSQNPAVGKNLTLLNFGLPSFITIGFLVWGTIEMFVYRKRIKFIKLLLITLIFLEIISIKWQIEYLNWLIVQKSFEETIPMTVALLMMIFLFVKFIRELKKNNSAQQAA